MNETITTVLYCAFLAMQVADVLTTIRALDGGCVEANKIVRWVMDKLGVVPALAVLKVAASGIMLAAVILSPILTGYALIALCALYACVIINNIRAIRASGGKP